MSKYSSDSPLGLGFSARKFLSSDVLANLFYIPATGFDDKKINFFVVTEIIKYITCFLFCKIVRIRLINKNFFKKKPLILSIISFILSKSFLRLFGQFLLIFELNSKKIRWYNVSYTKKFLMIMGVIKDFLNFWPFYIYFLITHFLIKKRVSISAISWYTAPR